LSAKNCQSEILKLAVFGSSFSGFGSQDSLLWKQVNSSKGGKMKVPTIVFVILLIFLTGCGGAEVVADTPTPAPTNTPIPPSPTPKPTVTPTPEPTATPLPTPTFTPVPTPTEAPCSNVDLNGRYVDFRTFRGAIYGWIMLAEQTGCEFKATETFFLKAAGPGSEGYAEELTGTIEGDKVRVCYTSSGYCLNLVIFGRGDKLVNGVEGWQYEKSDE
jgi:hypothetical protein